MPFLLSNWRIIAAGVGVVAVLLFGWYIHGQIYQSGVTACENANALAVAEQKETARGIIIEMGKSYDKDVKDFISKGDTGHGVGMRTSDAFDKLRQRSDQQ